MTLTISQSALDQSVNIVRTIGPGEALEARYVRRSAEELIVYLSSQTACAQRCRFCHLTTTGQVAARDATMTELLQQAENVLTHYDVSVQNGAPVAGAVNFNFMARGEPLANRSVPWDRLLEMLDLQAWQQRLQPRFKVSTIIPTETPRLRDIFTGSIQPDIYYSLYSLRDDFRRRWMPSAAPFEVGLRLLAEWQNWAHKIPRIHLALIRGENDDPADIEALARAATGALRVDFNIVRYNPPDERTSEGDVSIAYSILRRYAPTQVVDRVGFDVQASCGMFVNV
jgi:adenine C2-methylase RlmN of 23S rRNA A2503 and tRNA A37